MEQGILYGSRDPFCPLTLNWQRFVTAGRSELRVVNSHRRWISVDHTCRWPWVTTFCVIKRAFSIRRRHRHPREDPRRHVRHTRFPASYSCGKLTTRRHSREDVGEDVGVGVGACRRRGMPA